MASAAVTASEYAAAAKLAAATPKPTDKTFRYGTAGFRSLASTLDSTFLRVGMLAALRGQNVKQVGESFVACGVCVLCPMADMMRVFVLWCRLLVSW